MDSEREGVNKLLLKVMGCIAILVGVLDIYLGASSIIQKWGHDLSAGLWQGAYVFISGIGLLKNKKWAIVMIAIPLGIICAMIAQMIIFDKPASPVALLMFILILLSVGIILFSQWNTCGWK